MRAVPGTRTTTSRSAGMRIALTGAGLSLMLAMAGPFVLSHPAQGVALPAAQGNSNERSNAEPRVHELSRAEAVALVQRRYRARVVRTQLLQDPNGRPIYEFRLLSGGGKVWTVRIDAYSGAELP